MQDGPLPDGMNTDRSRDAWEVQATAFPSDGSIEEQAQFLLRYAILAPSTHNSQPWAFAVDGGTVDVYADESRWLEVADPDGRELYVSVGCAVENLVVAAAHFGFEATVDVAPETDPSLAARVTLREADPSPAGLFPAITERRTNHGVYEDRPLPVEFVDRLGAAADEPGVELYLVDDEATREELAELQARADERLFEDPAYREELGHWIGSGALGARWLTARIGQLAVTHLDLGDREAKKNSKLVTSAPAMALLTTDANDRAAQVEAGRTFERAWLFATVEGVAVHPMNQIRQVSDLKRELVERLDLADRSLQVLFRLGYAAPEETRRPRRPLGDVLRE